MVPRLFTALILVALAAPMARAADDAALPDTPRVMSVIEWLNTETRNSELAVLGQVVANGYPNAATGRVKVTLKVGQVYNGPPLGKRVEVELKPGFRGGKYLMPSPLLKDQWALLFLRNEGGHWVAPPVGRVIETPYKGLTFYPGYNVVLEDAAPGLSWSYVLDSLQLLVATRKQIMSGYMPQLRTAVSKEQRDRIQWTIEMQVKEQLGLPVP
ncbi:MAG: hypothetical protein JWM80_5713 [Cyanobacteria bacterium RYN_339]|nr:hypothetical protein [Cyanobacteria bacterium RYN_339]